MSLFAVKLKTKSPTYPIITPPTMTEVSFTKEFLTKLDSRPIKLQSDYATDLRTLEIRVPVSSASTRPSS